MKKFLFLFLMSLVLFCSCNGCGTKNEEVAVVDSVEVVNDSVAALDVDHAIATDRQAMYINYKDDYRWYETEILLSEFMDSDSATSDPEMIVNVLQSIVEKGNGADVWVHKFQHFLD